MGEKGNTEGTGQTATTGGAQTPQTTSGGGGGPQTGSGGSPAGGMTLEEAQARNSLPQGWTFREHNGTHWVATNPDNEVAVFQNSAGGYRWLNTNSGDYMTPPALDPSGQTPL